ncbi:MULTISPECIES: extracellular solute-binding protein [unclassified Kitasatospora]|uniref:sugar ABC transporter substrate-binding protein n=1 Tax=unclassified Kitasatospora TaxID=2633591 RepID=UPI00340FAA02
MRYRRHAALGVLALLVTACGGTSPAGTPSPVTPAAGSSAAGGAPGGPMTDPPIPAAEGDLVIWAQTQQAAALQPVADRFGKEHGVKVTVVPQSVNTQQAYVSATNAGKGPDLVVGASDWLGNLVQNGVVAPVPLTGAQKASFEPAALEAVQHDGRPYGLPYATESLVLFRNTELAPDAPATFEDLAAAGQGAVKAGRSDVPLALPIGQQGNAYALQPLFTSAGGYLFGTKADGGYDTADLGVGGPGSIAAGELFKQYGEKGSALFNRSVDTNAIALFTERKTPFLVAGPWALGQLKQSGLPYAISPVPGWAGKGQARPFIGVQSFYLSAKARNVPLAQEFLLREIGSESGQLALYQASPEPPALTSALARASATDPDIGALAAAGAGGQPLPTIPAMNAIWGPLGQAEANIVAGADPATTMKQAGEAIRAALGSAR